VTKKVYFLYAISFLTAFLLFQIELITAKIKNISFFLNERGVRIDRMNQKRIGD
jgi:hypothetical protein